jgi:excisionase family DNA binding protein
MTASSPIPSKVWYTMREAAEYVRISYEGMKKQVQRGRIKADSDPAHGRRFGLRFRRETLDAFVTGGGGNNGG